MPPRPPTLNQRTTGLFCQQLTTLLTNLRAVITWFKPNEKPRKPTLNQALKLTLIYYRQNLTVNS